jgi:ATP-dependent Clp protease protease subunit
MLKLIYIYFLLIFSVCGKEIVLTPNNTLVFDDVVTGQMVSQIIREARELDDDSLEPIYLFLNTPGGSIYAGLELIEALNTLRRPVHTITLFAASMGFHFVQNFDKRYILQFGELMSHRARGEFAGEFPGQLDSRYHLMLRKIRNMDNIVVMRTNGKQTLEGYLKSIQNELWLNGWEAVEEGYADEIATVHCDKTLNGTREKKFQRMGFNITLVFDKCPMITYPIDFIINVNTNKGEKSLNEFINNNGKFKDCKKTELCATNSELDINIIMNTKNNILKEVLNKKE